MDNKKEKLSFFSFLIIALALITVGVSFLFWKEMRVLNNAYSDMNQIEFLSSSTQRLISIAQTESFLQKDVFFIGDTTQKALTPNTEDSISVLSDPVMVELSNEVLESWLRIEDLLQQDPINKIDLGLSRDDHFKSMTNLSNGISGFSKEVNQRITNYQIVVLTLFFTMSMIMLNNLLRTHTALKNSKELAKTAQIDTSTGLYNRSRCQDLFKSTKTLSNKKHPAIIVIDLNDLKKTNDTLGHRAGDELILSFANTLKKACDVHVVPPFMGRYGGDEFIVYYDDVLGESDITDFLKELDYLKDEFNNSESKFQISFAAGYAFMDSESNDQLTTRQLFDLADERMYENKTAMKEKKAKGEDK